LSTVPSELGLPAFRPRFPWWGGDLQTLRDSVRPPRLPSEQGRRLEIPIGAGDRLLALLEQPRHQAPCGVVLVLHGLGGGADGVGPRRLALALLEEGFAVVRLNLRGAGPGRPLARGSYAARCSRDLEPVVRQARAWAEELGVAAGGAGRPLPLVGAGTSLGGTILLNACLDGCSEEETDRPALDGLVCISSPLDLSACALQFERPRNGLYQQWLVERLCRQVLADPFGLAEGERRALSGADRPRTIRAFDAAITAPRWGYASVAAYYAGASPGPRLVAGAPLPATLVLQAADDPWVPAEAAQALAALPPDQRPAGLEVVVAPQGGHNGFHAPGDRELGCWSDLLTARWLRRRVCG
jgi:predicted alpha/beta-fold hydrolase